MIFLRLALATSAGALIGLDREEHNRPAGLRTTMLVCLAAAVAMLQANLLMPSAVEPPGSPVALDLMRLPLGILTGMGFIGGGVILRRDGLVLGITTAATLWYSTVLGLCFGGGQLRLGLVALALGLLVLLGLRGVDRRVRHDRRGLLTLITENDDPAEERIAAILRAGAHRARVSAIAFERETARRRIEFGIEWKAATASEQVPPFLPALIADARIVEATWKTT